MKVIGVIIPGLPLFLFFCAFGYRGGGKCARGYRVMVAQSNERYDKEVAICEDFYKNKVCGIRFTGEGYHALYAFPKIDGQWRAIGVL